MDGKGKGLLLEWWLNAPETVRGGGVISAIVQGRGGTKRLKNFTRGKEKKNGPESGH